MSAHDVGWPLFEMPVPGARRTLQLHKPPRVTYIDAGQGPVRRSQYAARHQALEFLTSWLDRKQRHGECWRSRDDELAVLPATDAAAAIAFVCPDGAPAQPLGPDLSGHPWAGLRVTHVEQDMPRRKETNDVLSDFNEIVLINPGRSEGTVEGAACRQLLHENKEESFMRILLTLASTAAALLCTSGVASAQAPQVTGASGLTMDQVVIQTGPSSAARGAPISGDFSAVQMVGPGLEGGRGPGVYSARDGAVPEGITPLERTIYTSDDFYADRDLWMDPRYYQCASPFAVEALWGAYELQSTGPNPPATIPWGYCDRDFPREAIVSPYPYATAQEQYEALLAEARSRGGPTVYTHDNPAPDWNGVYQMMGFKQFPFTSWLGGATIQIPTYMSVLTPEYQKRFVQQEYHYGHDNSMAWPGAYCWPDGFMRRFVGGFDRWVQVSPEFVSMWTDDSETLMTHVNIGRDFKTDGPVPRLGEDVRRWFGETVGFWDGDILVTWTSNIRGWYAHGWFEYSDKMQSIEIYTPITGQDGKFVGINHETILFDEDALAEPVRIIENWEKARGLAEGNPFDWRECVIGLYPINGLQTRVQPGDKVEVTVPYLYGRPWADVWVEYFEQNMQIPPDPNDPLAQFE